MNFHGSAKLVKNARSEWLATFDDDQAVWSNQRGEALHFLDENTAREVCWRTTGHRGRVVTA